MRISQTVNQLLPLLAFTTVAAATSSAQTPPIDQRVEWLRQHAVAIRTLDPADEDYEDLEPLGEAIGDARVVLLGEATHGDGAAFLAKGRLVKFLHGRKGFDVLAWEAGFYDTAKVGESLAAGGSWHGLTEGAIFDMWSRTDQCRPVMDYVCATQRTDRPIALVGMSWYTSADSALFDDVVALFEAVDPSLPTRKQRRALKRIKRFLGNLDAHRRPKTAVDPPGLEHMDAMIDLLARDPDGKFSGKHGARQVGFMRMALENLKSFMQFWHRPLTRGGADDNPLGVLEARNIEFLTGEYLPGRKMIVWAHNGHIARGSSQIAELKQKFKFAETIATGQRIHDKMGNAMYSVMLIAHGGKSNGWWGEPRDLSPPPEGSLEDLMHRAGLKLAFLDLRHLPPNHWLRERLVARPVSYAPMRADWSQVYDGLLFIDVMTPSTSSLASP